VADKKIFVYYLITELGVAGAERVLYNLATKLDKEAFEVRVACLLKRRGEVGRWLAREGIPVDYIDASSRLQVGKLFGFKKRLRELRPDILHTHLFHANIFGRTAARLAGTPHVVSTVHIPERRFRPWQFLMDRLTLGWADCEVCVSNAVLEFTARKVKRRDKLRLIYNGLDVEGLGTTGNPDAVKNELGVAADGPVVGSVGRLDRQKGYIHLVRAFARLRKSFPRAGLVIVGEGPERRRLEAEASKLNIASAVRLPGFRGDVASCINVFDVFCAPSLYEGFGLTVAEAALLEKPIVASNVDSIPEIVADGETALLVEAGDEEGLARCIAELLTDKERARAMGRRAARFVHERFSIEAMVQQYAGLYREILNRGKRGVITE